MNMLDRAIGWIAPRTAVDRAVARITLDQVRTAYDGAKSGRRTSGWLATNASANAATKGALHLLRARSRDVVRNTWWGNRIVSVVTGHAVGSGITPVCKVSQQAIDLWNEWGSSTDEAGQAQSDQEGQLTIDGQIALACRAIVEAGEVLGRFVPLPRSSGRRVPLEFQLLEPDHLDGSRDRFGFVTPRAGVRDVAIVDQGIEYNAQGKRAAYWLFPEHPGARGIVGTLSSIRVPASDVLHVYRKERIGQGRGVPWVAPVLLKGRDVADLEEAIVVKARVEACLALLIKSNDAARTLAASTNETAADGKTRRLETLSPAMIHYLDRGEEATVVNPSSSLAFESVLINSWMTLCAGAGITYDQGTGDLRQANYSSLRAGKIEFRRLIEQFQYLTLVPMLLNRIWGRFIAASVDNGALPYRLHGYPVEWIMPANEPIDPLKDLQADILAVRSGRITWAHFVAAWGFNPDTQLDEIATWLQTLDEKKIVLDSDPRRVAPSIKGAPKTEANAEEIANVGEA
jgi:lambda family phage portal protein